MVLDDETVVASGLGNHHLLHVGLPSGRALPPSEAASTTSVADRDSARRGRRLPRARRAAVAGDRPWNHAAFRRLTLALILLYLAAVPRGAKITPTARRTHHAHDKRSRTQALPLAGVA